VIFLLFVTAVVVVELVLRHEPKRRLSVRRVERVSTAQDRDNASLEGLMALSRALDRYGQGEHPVVNAVAAVHARISGRESSD
jgi:hypothetical protein